MPTFSIIMPVYNVAPYLRECLDSVLAQTFADWEAICVDDGSTDGSGAILDEYAVRDSRFRVIHQPNAGVSAARNAALDVAQGDWIGFVDGDDFVGPTWLSNVAQEITTDPSIEAIRTNCTMCEAGVQSSRNLAALGCSLWMQISRCSFPFVLFFRRGRFGSVRFVNGIRFREDALFQYEIATRRPKLKISSEDGYCRRENRIGCATLQVRRRDDTYKLLRAYLKIWRMLPKKERGENRQASTFWIAKDVREWLQRCPDRTKGDGLKVWAVLCRIALKGGFNPFCTGTVFEGLRWTFYLISSFWPILFFTRLSFKGR